MDLFRVLFLCIISIHSTARVETIYLCEGRGWERINFNPLHREGGDRLKLSFANGFLISIHSTARVETYHIDF